MASSSKLPNFPGASEEDLSLQAQESEQIVDEVKTFIFEVDAARRPTTEAKRIEGPDGLPSRRSRTTPPADELVSLDGDSEKASTSRRTDELAPAPIRSNKKPGRPQEAKPAQRFDLATSTRTDSAHTKPLKPSAASAESRKQQTAAAKSLGSSPRKVRQQRPTSKGLKRRRKIPSWAVSLVAHALLLLVLSFATLATMETSTDFGLLASVPVAEPLEEFTDVQLDAESLDEFAEELPAELLDPGAASMSDLTAEAALADVASELGPVATGDLADLGALFGDAGAGPATLGDGMGVGGPATFFGEEIEGNRIVFLVDNSGGMQRGGLEALCSELKNCVEQLKGEQRFYVIFYSDTIYPLFYPDPAENFIRATPRNLALLDQWLDTVEVCLGNAIDEGLAATTAIHPDVVYLLTDGRVNTTRDGRKLNMFLDAEARRFTIHTLGMGTGESGDAAEQLRQIAEANGGAFRAVEIDRAHREAADEKSRPYHNQGPGLLWGRQVKPPRR